MPLVDPWVTLAAIAMHTERIRIGTTLTPVARRRPWKLARETVTWDQLSGGRLILTVGLGIRPMLILLNSVKTRMPKYAPQSWTKD